MTYLTWKQTLVILGLILCLGFGLRIYGLGNNSFVADEFLDMNSSYGYFKTGEWKAWDFNRDRPSAVNLNQPRDERATIYKWQVAQLFRFLPPTEETARLVSVLWGVLSLCIVFWSTFVFTKRREVALIATLLTAVSVASIIFDRRLRMYAMFAPLYLALATTLYLTLEQTLKTKWAWLRRGADWSQRFGFHLGYALVTVGLLGISLLTHQLTGVIVFSMATYLVIAGAREYRALGMKQNKYLWFLGLGLLSLVMVRWIAPSFFASFIAGLMLFDNHYSYLGYVMKDYAHPLLMVFLFGFGLYSLSFRERQPKVALYLAVSFSVPLILAIWFFRRNAGPQYIFFAQSFGLILVASGVFGLWEMIRERFAEWKKSTALAVLIGLILLVPNFGYFFEENTTYHETSSGGNPNYRKVFEYVKKNRQPEDVLVTRNVRNYYWSGADIFVYDLGDEVNRVKLSGDALQRIMQNNESGWVVLSDNDYDYFSPEAEVFMKKHMERVSNAFVRGPIDVYRWGRVTE